ncbi:MAG: hypothetical protein V4549_06515 [Bacteroidota bacterium]
MITVDFKNDMLRKLIEREDGSVGPITGQDKEMKVEAIKIIIDWGQDVDNGFIVEFNSDYTRIRKRVITNKIKTTNE